MGEDFMENWYTEGDRLYAQWAQPKVSETHTDFPNIPMFDLSTGEYSSDYITARGWEGGTSGNITDRDAYYKTLFQMHTDKLDEYDFRSLISLNAFKLLKINLPPSFGILIQKTPDKSHPGWL